MDFHSLLELSNVLLIPAVIYIVLLERRLTRIETMLKMHFKEEA